MNTVYFVDFDHTISKRDVWDSIVKMFSPDDWKTIIRNYLSGAVSSRVCNRQLAELVQPREEEARKLVYSIGIDPTFHDFVQWVKESESEMIIVSDGYDYYIDLLLEKEGLEDLNYFSNRMVWTENGIEVEFPLYKENCERDMAHCKCQHVFKHEGIRRVYIGDGISDTCAAQKCEKIYAKRNLLDYCREQDIECTPFENFLDIIQSEKDYLTESQFAVSTDKEKKMSKSITVPYLKKMKKRGEKISMLTAYDYTFAALMDEAGVDVLLVGDSLGMVFQGHQDTLPVTVEDIVYHTQAVKRGAKHSMVVADMPFLSYQINAEEAVRNAGKLLKEGGADAVKLEGGVPASNAIKKMVDTGIPVMGHVGLGPQSCKLLGGHKVQGKTSKAVQRLLKDAEAVEQAGAFSLVIEAVPWPVAQMITERVSIPTIGIGAGPHCDGQVLVFADMLGLFTSFQPHFVRRFAQLGKESKNAFSEYCKAVKEGSFPTLDESYWIEESALQEFEEISNPG